jgi:hypothetical protein
MSFGFKGLMESMTVNVIHWLHRNQTVLKRASASIMKTVTVHLEGNVEEAVTAYCKAWHIHTIRHLLRIIEESHK